MQRLNRGMMGRYDIPERFPGAVNAVQFGMGETLLGTVDRLIDDARIGVGIAAAQAGETGYADLLREQDGMYTLIVRGEVDEQPVSREQVVQCVLTALDPETDGAALEDLARDEGVRLGIIDTCAPGYRTAVAQAARFLKKRWPAHPGLDLICLGEDGGCARRVRDDIFNAAFACDDGFYAMDDMAIDSLGPEYGFARWLDSKNDFVPAVADSLAFRSDADEAARLCATMNYADGMIHIAEPFARLTIQADADFRARWPLDQAPGVRFTDDIGEELLLRHRVFDAGLFALAAPGWLLGCDTLSDCMRHARLRACAGHAWTEEIMPFVQADRELVARRVIEACGRFENAMNRNAILRRAAPLLGRFARGALPLMRAYADENFEAPRGLSYALAATIMLYAGARPNADGVYEVARAGKTEALTDDAGALETFSRLAHDMPPETLAYAALADRTLWGGADLREIDGLEQRVALDIAAMQRDPAFVPEYDME